MPNVEVTTNVPKDKIPNDFAKYLVDMVAKLYDYPVIYVDVVIRSDSKMSFGGKDNPAAVVNVTSLATDITKEKNKKICAALYPQFEKILGITGEMMMILFHGTTGDNIGFKGTTM
ncbi:macrophage migration inhibitory factor-like protein [Leptotrombidium deliense]|uniref:L-dopachrome isomerase n=1 Tax=Leptotrombidium deliense TaxID=299467 RepID=A0A443S5F7_9ACAR|nr:macrophage migration inhibitory factor-like protein [Leptotrombidium deliense]